MARAGDMIACTRPSQTQQSPRDEPQHSRSMPKASKSKGQSKMSKAKAAAGMNQKIAEEEKRRMVRPKRKPGESDLEAELLDLLRIRGEGHRVGEVGVVIAPEVTVGTDVEVITLHVTGAILSAHLHAQKAIFHPVTMVIREPYGARLAGLAA